MKKETLFVRGPYLFCYQLLIIFLFTSLLMFPGYINGQEDDGTQDTALSESNNSEGATASADQVSPYAALDETYAQCNTLQRREKALNELKGLLKATPSDYELLWRTARIIWSVGDWLEDDQSKRLEKLGIEGMEYADRALKTNQQGLEGHYYKALTISTYSRGISIIKALIKGLSDDYVSNLEYVIERDKNFDRGGPLRALGRYYWKLPWPKYDYKLSLKYLDQALKVNPHVLRTHFYRADTLWALKKYKEARKSFEYVIETEPQPFDARDLLWLKKQAPKRLRQLIKEEF